MRISVRSGWMIFGLWLGKRARLLYGEGGIPQRWRAAMHRQHPVEMLLARSIAAWTACTWPEPLAPSFIRTAAASQRGR